MGPRLKSLCLKFLLLSFRAFGDGLWFYIVGSGFWWVLMGIGFWISWFAFMVLEF